MEGSNFVNIAQIVGAVKEVKKGKKVKKVTKKSGKKANITASHDTGALITPIKEEEGLQDDHQDGDEADSQLSNSKQNPLQRELS